MMRKKDNTAAKRLKLRLLADKVPFEFTEAYNSLRTNINFITANCKNRKIVITSTLRDEGKSSLSVNMALSLAQTGNKVLLIDADLRNPSLHRYLRLEKDINHGLSNLLSGNVKVGECLVKTEYGVDVITGGAIPPNPAELVSSDSMRNLLDVAVKHYDYVICDAPPVGIITDAAALSPLCDGVLFVVRYDFANKYQIRDALNKLKVVNAKILGAVMMRYEIPQKKNKRYGYNYGYSYGYSYGYGPKDDEA